MNVDKTKIGKEIKRIEVRLKKYPNSLSLLEGMGRGQRALGNASASKQYLEAFLQKKKRHPVDHAEQREILGAIHRLLGDVAAEKSHFEAAYRLKHQQTFQDEEINDVYLEQVIRYAFLAEKWDELIAHVATFKQIAKEVDPELQVFYMADIVDACRSNNLELASATISNIERAIKNERVSPLSTGGYTLWDLYEDALAVATRIRQVG